MTYELAKELEDAGFPQLFTGEPGGGYNICNPETDCCAYAPTLSELIEACGQGLAGLLAPDWKGNLGKDWEALRNDVTGTNVCVSGATPEEAIARLWLALNRK